MSLKSFGSFKSYINEEELNEVLITFGNRPNFGQVVLLAGGAGSGKGFIGGKANKLKNGTRFDQGTQVSNNNLLGIEAKIFDVDDIKGKIIHPGTPKLNKKIKGIYGIDVTTLDLRNPDNVALLHKINDEMGISKKEQELFFRTLPSNKEILPNIIFDTTGKSEGKIQGLCDMVINKGYDKKNIHIVWVMNDVEIAKKQNKTRDRVVPEDILVDTHMGVAHTMQNLMKNSRFQEFIDGYVYIVFNKKDVDSTLLFSEFGGSFVEEALILEIKRRGKKQLPYSAIADRFIMKIKAYVPKAAKRLWGR